MKRILLTLIIVFITTLSFAQTEYPFIEIREGDKRVIVLTIEQANILVSKAELLWLYEQYFEQRNDIDNLVVRIIDNQNKIIFEQDALIHELKQYSKNKDERINILMNQIKLYEQVPSIEKIYIKDETASKKLKRTRIVSGGLLVIILILIL
jgi:predicted nucleic-acid-binding protein